MGAWLQSMSSLEILFLVCAVVGGVLFVCKLVLQLMGGDTDMADDLPDDVPDDVPVVDMGIGDSDVSFRLISLQGVMAFLMIFGLVGLALKRTGTGGDAQALILAVAGGFGVMFLQAKLMTYLLRLQTSGTLDMRNAVGAEGTVYLTIPSNGTGKVRVVVQERLKVFDATAMSKQPIETGERIRVVEVTGGSILVVEKLDAV